MEAYYSYRRPATRYLPAHRKPALASHRLCSVHKSLKTGPGKAARVDYEKAARGFIELVRMASALRPTGFAGERNARPSEIR